MTASGIISRHPAAEDNSHHSFCREQPRSTEAAALTSQTAALLMPDSLYPFWRKTPAPPPEAQSIRWCSNRHRLLYRPLTVFPSRRSAGWGSLLLMLKKSFQLVLCHLRPGGRKRVDPGNAGGFLFCIRLGAESPGTPHRQKRNRYD